MKDIWCTFISFKAASLKLNWEKKPLTKNCFKNKISHDLYFFYPLRTHFYPQPNKLWVKMADVHAINLQCFDYVCNLLFIICQCHYHEIFQHFLKKVKQFGKTWWMDWEDRTIETFLAVGEACIAILWPTPGFKGRLFYSSGFST